MLNFIKSKILNSYDYVMGNTPLHIAARDGVLNGPITSNINVRNNRGSTPLHLAVQAGNVANVTYLLQNGANYYAMNANLKIPAIESPQVNREACIAVLQQFYTSLTPAEIALMLLESKQDLNRRCENTFMRSIFVSCFAIFTMLISKELWKKFNNLGFVAAFVIPMCFVAIYASNKIIQAIRFLQRCCHEESNHIGVVQPVANNQVILAVAPHMTHAYTRVRTQIADNANAGQPQQPALNLDQSAAQRARLS